MTTIGKKTHTGNLDGTQGVQGAATGSIKPNGDKPQMPDSTVAGGLEAQAPSASATPAGSVIKDLAAKSDYKVVKMVNTPTESTGSMASWKLGDYKGFMLKPGEEMLLEIPAKLRGCGEIAEAR